MKRFLLLQLLLLAGLLAGCIEDKSAYDYRKANEVSFLDVSGGYIFTAGQTARLEAPVEFSEEVADPDEQFEFNWYLDRQLIGQTYELTYDFPSAGGFSLVLKVVNRSTGETYLSDAYTIQIKSSVGWGWMLLTDRGDGKSGISFIAPDSYFVTHGLETSIDGGLGSDPRGIYYYYVLGSIAGSYISGLPKVLVNQGSGSVTLDGQTLQKDMWLREEFENGAEPADLDMLGFAWKGSYYLICSREGDVYARNLDSYENEKIPYYGKYASMPCEVDGGAKFSCFQGFQNVSYWCADEDYALAFDERNARFVSFVKGNATNSYNCGVVPLFNYDQELVLPAGVRPVNDLGAGTKCLAIGAYENVYVGTSGSLDFWPSYVSLVDLAGAGNYQLCEFGVSPLGFGNHVITEASQRAFSGGTLLTDKSVVRMSANFEKNPYFYFTDGDKNLYVYSMQAGTHCLAYTASSRITHICASPIVCAFGKYGGNSTGPNYRLALVQEDGQVAIVDVAQTKMVQLFSGMNPSLELRTLSGFGDVKGIVWCTNFEGEY